MAMDKIVKNPKIHKVQLAHSFTSNTSLAYTGASITIPANCIYAFLASAMFINSSPKIVSIGKSSTSSPSILAAEYVNTSASASLVGTTGNSAVTFYIWAQYNSASENRIDIDGFYIEL